MTTVDRLFNEALELSEGERWELVERLLGDGPPVTGPRDLDEFLKRVDDVRSGRVAGMTIAEVEAGLDQFCEQYRGHKGS